MAYHIVQIPIDEQGIKTWVEKYKAFRLYSLKTDPASFGSTYEREVAFTDDVWSSRLSNPQGATFIALEEDRVVSTVTILGHLPYNPEEIHSVDNPVFGKNGDEIPPLDIHYRLFGVYVLPDSRGKGIAQALIGTAVKYAKENAAKSGRDYVVSIATDEINIGAVSLYQKCGFVLCNRLPYGDPVKWAVMMKFSPS